MNKSLKTILLVEDEPDIQTVARLSLETFGNFTVHICSGGQEALDKAPTIMPDLIMLDVMMPIMDGLSTLKALRSNPKLNSIPVIFMTAKAQSNEMKHYIESGAVGVISKPFDPQSLVQEINEIWSRQ
jgi:two-component system OmpR family response regulator